MHRTRLQLLVPPVLYTLGGSGAAVSAGSCDSDDERFCESMAVMALSVAADSCWALLSVFTISCITVSWIPSSRIRSGCWKNTRLSARSLHTRRGRVVQFLSVRVIRPLPYNNSTHIIIVCVWLGARVVRTLDLRLLVASSNPGLSAIECNPRQVVNIHVPLSPSSIIWYQQPALRLGR